MDHRPLYTQSLDEAILTDQVKTYHQSLSANIDCAAAIKAFVQRHFDGYHLEANLPHDIIKAYGQKRVAFVLANTIRQKGYDGRISYANKVWADSVEVPTLHASALVLDGSSGLLDLFTTQFRQYLQQEKKPSITQQLANAKRPMPSTKNHPTNAQPTR